MRARTFTHTSAYTHSFKHTRARAHTHTHTHTHTHILRYKGSSFVTYPNVATSTEVEGRVGRGGARQGIGEGRAVRVGEVGPAVVVRHGSQGCDQCLLSPYLQKPKGGKKQLAKDAEEAGEGTGVSLGATDDDRFLVPVIPDAVTVVSYICSTKSESSEYS